MIRECEEHGYFRAERCPVCGEEGKFIMSDKEVERIGRTLAAILRHGKFEPDMDDQGYVPMQEVVSLIRARHTYMNWLRPRHIEAIIETDPKGRYAIANGKIRATYGHTIPLDIKLDNQDIPPELFYPVDPSEVEDILRDGIDTGVGGEVGSDRGRAAKTVFLSRHVPSDAIDVADSEDWDTGEDEEEREVD